MKNFRLLRADEIECRVSTVKESGLSLLLYKDARCDMNILDETVGMMNWQKEYSRENRNCTVSIWDSEKSQWISKEDTGTESYTEAEKGLASDSFKRACFNWGIGRELYSAPFIWVPAGACKIQPKGSGYTCFDRFKVDYIGYDESERINALKITNTSLKRVAYTLGADDPAINTAGIAPAKVKALRKLLKDNGVPEEYVCGLYKVAKLEDFTEAMHANAVTHMEELRLRYAKEAVK